ASDRIDEIPLRPKVTSRTMVISIHSARRSAGSRGGSGLRDEGRSQSRRVVTGAIVPDRAWSGPSQRRGDPPARSDVSNLTAVLVTHHTSERPTDRSLGRGWGPVGQGKSATRK